MSVMDDFRAQRRTDARQIFPFPQPGECVEENPPCFSWLYLEGAARYHVTVRTAQGALLWETTTDKNYAVPGVLLPTGDCVWEVEADGLPRGVWPFTLAEKAVPFLRPTVRQVLDAVPKGHPRHLFCREDISKLCDLYAPEMETLRRNVALALSRELPARPLFHRDAQATPYREYFGRFRDDCDRDLIACALQYALEQDAQAGAHAKALLLTICDWNPEGPCSVLGQWGDEIGLSCARCLPAAYDLLYDLLEEKQRVYVQRTLRSYALQCEERLRLLDYCRNPGDSHAGRLPAYLGEMALVLADSVVPKDEIERWLAYALDIFGGIFPYYGCTDGGWAEGAFYCTSYTKWYLPFFSAVARYTGVNFLDRPFYQRLPQFLVHFASPYAENHPFGDGYWSGSEDPEWPGFFAQNPFRVYASRAGQTLAMRWEKALASPPLFKLHLLDVFLPPFAPPRVALCGQAENCRAFPQAGFVSLHTALQNPEADAFVLARASRYGSDSHRHADQGSFAYFRAGVALISPSGYFGREYGTPHHRLWTNTTRAHNAILVDGQGQAPFDMNDVGRIAEWGEGFARLDLTAAYPMLQKWERRIVLSPDGTLTVSDSILSDTPVCISFLLHTLSQPTPAQDGFTLCRKGVELTMRAELGLLPGCTVTDEFAVPLNQGVPGEYAVEMPPQYHVAFTSPRACAHEIVVVLSSALQAAE